MDLPRLVDAMERQALYFPSIRRLSELDPFEGSYAKLNVESPTFGLSPEVVEGWGQDLVQVLSGFLRVQNAMRRETVFVNSWHVQDCESAAMWSIYDRTGSGLAIQSTYENFTRALDACKDYQIFVGMVDYIDYETQGVQTGNLLYPFMYKRKSFEHEHELRALVSAGESLPEEKRGIATEREAALVKHMGMSGIHIPVDIEALIERIYVAPTAPKWVMELVSSVAKRYGLAKEVIASTLLSKPTWQSS
ncbi:MAG: hypothetical protein NTU41_09735 [Chloroflexi bacterium]|nr:hypothetical protein [Chloroflexota bacterium]